MSVIKQNRSHNNFIIYYRNNLLIYQKFVTTNSLFFRTVEIIEGDIDLNSHLNSQKLPAPPVPNNRYDIDLVCLSHLRWDFVYQRPQHLMSRFAYGQRVFFVEEPIFSDDSTRLDIRQPEENLSIVVPHISNADRETHSVEEIQRNLLDKLFAELDIKKFVLWFYTPMAMSFASHLQPNVTIYDCMDELSAFKFASPELLENERRLFAKADLVFTGGQSLYEAKKDCHERVFAFPSSIDVEHFQKARSNKQEPEDQKNIARPRFGYCGVIDERIDLKLLEKAADARPEWQFIMIGPVVKISDKDLPRRLNIHYLGGKNYQELPDYMASWDVALMPFAINESTKFISPTKTPEYLAAGKPVVSTPVRDVVRVYGENNLARIASTADEFVDACEKALSENAAERIAKADEFLAKNSWEKTWAAMQKLILEQGLKGTKLASA
jgi:UDP-galactopyranose mutase